MPDSGPEVIVKYVDPENGEVIPKDRVTEKVRELAPAYRPDAVPDLGDGDEWDLEDLSERYGICAAECSDGTPCKQRAGESTEHLGFGRCRRHGTTGITEHGRYSKLRSSISEKLTRFKNRDNPLDITDEIALMRGMFETFINDYEEIKEALIAWNSAETEEAGRMARPRRLPELADGFEMLKGLSKVAQRQQRIDMEDAVSRRELRRVLQEFARVVEQEIPKEIPEDLDGDELVRRIKDGWNKIHIY